MSMDADEKKQKEKKLEETENVQPEEVEEKKEQVDFEEFDALKDLASKLEDQYKRAVADYQNLQRRTQEEKREWAKFANKDMVLKLLPILDTLMLAEKHTQDKNFVLTVQQFLSALQEEGVVRIKTIGEKFDPHVMEAVTTTEGEEGKVIDEARAGYMLYDIVLRPAQVVVGAK